jgi:predicted Zn-dependent peptidase
MPGNDTVIFDRLETGSNVSLFHYSTRKFKSVVVRFFLSGSLGSDVEEEAILPSILRRGSRDYPSLAAVSRALETLYGTRISIDVTKIGERQVFACGLNMVNERLLPNATGLIESAGAVCRDVLTNPLVEKESFLPAVFATEKINLERAIRSLINDKGVYAGIRLVEEMFRGQPYGNHPMGDAGKVAGLDPAKTYSFFRNFLNVAPMDVYVMGDITSDEALSLFRSVFGGIERGEEAALPAESTPVVGDGAVFEEEQAIEQSKLAIGFNVDNCCDDDLYFAFFFYNAILGGGAYSKLFKNVREKESLAYYASSGYDKTKGFLKISAGIQRENFSRAVEIVAEQMDDITAGKITDEEFSNARKSLLSGLRAVNDVPGHLIDYDFVTRLAGRENRIDRIADRVERVTRDQVAASGRLVTKGKTFFLKGTAG